KRSVPETIPIGAAGVKYVAVRVRARCEATIANRLAARGVSAICPVYIHTKRFCDRVKLVSSALFPSYIFSPFHVGLKNTIVMMPGVHEIVSAGKYVVPIEGRDLDLIQRLSVHAQLCRPTFPPASGQRVKIRSGAMSGFEGVFVRLKNTSRVV